jgi:hypothetical protein
MWVDVLQGTDDVRTVVQRGEQEQNGESLTHSPENRALSLLTVTGSDPTRYSRDFRLREERAGIIDG